MTPQRHRIRGLAAISAKFSTTDNKRTLELVSSVEEKRDDNQINALGPLLTCKRQGDQATCRTRRTALHSPVSCGKSSGPA